MTPVVEFTFEGQLVPAQAGQSVAAALLAAGRPSGLFCGIGVCFGCLVTVNGSPAQRGCLVTVHEGDVVRRAT